MKATILRLFFYVLAVLLWTPSVMAGSFTTTYEGIEGYQWLDFDTTIGKSRNAVESLSNVELEGYRYATRKETELLIEAIIGGPITFSGDPTNLNNISPPNWLTSFTTNENRVNDNNGHYNFKEIAFYYGASDEAADDTTLYGHFCFYEFTDTTLYGAYVYQCYGASSIVQDPASFGINYSYSSIASLLVRTPPYEEVPEPTTALLFSLGIVGIFTSKRKKRLPA